MNLAALTVRPPPPLHVLPLNVNRASANLFPSLVNVHLTNQMLYVYSTLNRS